MVAHIWVKKKQTSDIFKEAAPWVEDVCSTLPTKEEEHMWSVQPEFSKKWWHKPFN